jgi:hypothetical protein
VNPRLACLLVVLAALAACAHAPSAPGVAGGGGALLAEAPLEGAAAIDGARDLVLAVDNRVVAPGARAGSNIAGYGATAQYRSGQRAMSTLAEIKQQYGLREIAGWPIQALGLYCAVLRPPPGVAREALLQALSRDTRVRLAEPLHEYSLYAHDAAATGYNDPYVQLQRGFAQIDAARAQRVSQGNGVEVALVDTGVDRAHPDLAGRVRGLHDLVGARGSAHMGDRHGTEVAGVIAAVGNNHLGIVGIAPKATLSVYKACWQPAGTDGARCNTLTLAKALAALLDTDARIINMSLGGPEDPLLGMLLQALLQQRRIVVAALPPGGRVEGFPAATPGVIVVGAPSPGATSPAGVVNAPGVDILTTQPDGQYDFASGSSLAAAHVSGIAALLLSLSPGLDANAFLGILRDSSTRTGGVPLVNAAAAIDALDDGRPAGLASARAGQDRVARLVRGP